jgi:hypothetical protein
MLGRAGYTEAAVRRHSLEWVQGMIAAVGELEAQRYRGQMLAAISGVYHGYMGAVDEEGNATMREVLAELSGRGTAQGDAFDDPSVDSVSA